MNHIFQTETIQTLVPIIKTLAATPLTLLTTISAGFFEDTIRYCNLEQTKINSLLITSILFLFSFINTIRQRFNKRTFNCDFTFSLGISISFSIGLVYSVTDQRNIVQQTLFKIIITYSLSKTINTVCKIYTKSNHECCPICLQQLNNQIIQIKCKHIFHQHCIWKCISYKNNCPLCSTSL